MQHECSQKELINNVREKLNSFISKFESKFDDICNKYHLLSIKTELQEKDILSIKDDLKDVKETVSKISDQITFIEQKDSKRTVAILTGLTLNLLLFIVFLVKIFMFGGSD